MLHISPDQVLVDCTGDIALGGLLASEAKDEKAVLVICQNVPGVPGRTLTPDVYDFDKPHVVIRAENPRSLDAFIKILTALRDDLRSLQKTPTDGGPDEQS